MSKWFIKGSKVDYRIISKKYDINPIITKLLVNRNIDEKDMHKFLNPTYENSVHNPFLMKDMDKAVDMLIDSINNYEHIRIVGDYDQDGNSATMTLIDGIMIYNENISYAIPHRVEDGYGISKRIVDSAVEEKVDLIITCDNGITSFDVVEYAKSKGLKVIVTDHHQVKNENGVDVLPMADAVLNPNRQDCSYPFKKLCGAGVAFKLVQALYDKLDGDREYMLDLLEYVAMGTVCDVVDLVDENRYFVIEGLKRINNTENYGLKCLIKETGLKTEVNTYALGFIIGPCINAAGRLDSATLGIELFLEENMLKIEEIAKKLVSLNNERKKLTEEGLEKVEKIIVDENLNKNNILIVKEKSIHESIAGIIAGRIKEKYYKPTIVFTSSSEDGILKGSGRSIDEYNMFEEINKYNSMLNSFGGHPMAAGLSIKEELFEEFSSLLNENNPLEEDDLTPKIYLDSQLYANELTFDIIDEINTLEPFGKGNSKPVFGDKDIKINKLDIIGKNKNVIKFQFDIRNRLMEGIYFGDVSELLNYLENKFNTNNYTNKFVDIVYYPNINEFNGNKNIQLVIKEVR
ncbi:single-stranded-DNA-specific exonuclease RecJ [Miniphocaeibacter halophilus]|uniref:Single-stranded-DNA-specific exonuclease RecJ n=1 Tax=Miniphocaeibacter halophilus TaxID=2931922 RepID=A0AC61MUE4_9FIRM|nr:single-stranded-DNA-specific exonuclease RecJ [Miniphocaeibacter halophilus]QQK07803.1 single-stranded-DNA-specific exonuclease RecJ [Miniphocaeibacter halophilus]